MGLIDWCCAIIASAGDNLFWTERMHFLPRLHSVVDRNCFSAPRTISVWYICPRLYWITSINLTIYAGVRDRRNKTAIFAHIYVQPTHVESKTYLQHMYNYLQLALCYTCKKQTRIIVVVIHCHSRRLISSVPLIFFFLIFKSNDINHGVIIHVVVPLHTNTRVICRHLATVTSRILDTVHYLLTGCTI